MNSKEIILFKYVLENPEEYMDDIQVGWFSNSDLNETLRILKNYYRQYNSVPSIKNFETEIENNEDKDFILEAYKVINDVDTSSYDDDWLQQNTQSFLTWKSFQDGMLNSVEYVKSQNITSDNVESVINDAREIMDKSVYHFADSDMGTDFWDATTHQYEQADIIKSPWTLFNNACGGHEKGTMTCYMGQTNVGKSIFLCNDAAFYVKAGYNVLFISLEMSEKKVERRISANLLDLTLDDYDALIKDGYSGEIERRLSDLKKQGNMGKLIIKQFPTSQGSVADIKMLIKKLKNKKGFVPDILLVDYINIMGDKRLKPGLGLYEKIKFLAENLRGLAVEEHLLCETVTQINRSGFGELDIDMNAVSESAALLHTLDSLFAITQPVDLQEVDMYRVKLVKVRDGGSKNKTMNVHVDYPHMRLTECPPDEGADAVTTATSPRNPDNDYYQQPSAVNDWESFMN